MLMHVADVLIKLHKLFSDEHCRNTYFILMIVPDLIVALM